MRRLSLIPVLLLVLAGCGGGGHSTKTLTTTTTKTVTTQLAVGGNCDPHSPTYYMQCALQNQKAPPTTKAPRGPVAFGVDFAFGCQGPSSHPGSEFAVSYLSTVSSKNWSLGCINLWHAAGKKTAAVWETTATRATQGFAAGQFDARLASSQAVALGNVRDTIFFAIDFDASGSQVASYFQGVKSILGNRAGAYGGFFPLQYLCANHLVGPVNWQTYAWSHGLWLPASCAPLEQYDNNNSQFDLDRALLPYYGQWPSVAPGPTPAQKSKWGKARDSSYRAYKKHGCTQSALTKRDDCRTYGNRVLYFQGKLDRAHGKNTHCFGKGAKINGEACIVIRPNVSAWSHAREASRFALVLNGCNGPENFPSPVQNPLCNKLRQRQKYFDIRATVAVKQWS